MPMFNGKFILASTVPGLDSGLATKINKTGDNVSGVYNYIGSVTSPYTLQRITITSDEAKLYFETAQTSGTVTSDSSLTTIPGAVYGTYNYQDTNTGDYNHGSVQLYSTNGIRFEYDYSFAGVLKTGYANFSPSEYSLVENTQPYIATQPSHIATKSYVDSAIVDATFIPTDTLYSKRSIVPVSGSSTLFSNGMGTLGTNFSNLAGTIGSTSPTNTSARTRAIRSRISSSGSSNSYCSIGSNSAYPLCSMTFGWKAVISFGYGDNNFSASTRAFYGLIEGGIPAMSTQPSNLVNIIGIGNDATSNGLTRDVNLQIMYNDASGIASKIDLGANFPANRTSLAVSQAWIILEIYNAPGSTSVKYKVSNLENNAVSQGTITTGLPASSAMLGPVLIRGVGTAFSGVFVVEFGEVAVWTNG